jgi:ABC-type branched-subunit amino acid transport system substrate-binding protein
MRRIAIGLVATSLFAATALVATPGGAVTRRTATATNGTIVVGGLANVARCADAGIGAQARVARANDTNEIKGYEIEFKEIADDKNDPVTALAETRRLVSQEGVVAVVPDVSFFTPREYLTQQQIPWFGTGYDNSFCPESGKGGWGIAVYGCLLPANPTKMPGPWWELMKKELADKGVAKPTVALIGADSETGKLSMQRQASTAQGAGFKVVSANASFPASGGVGDVSPYAQSLLTADNGKQPDLISLIVDSGSQLQLISLLKSSGYTGTFLSSLYSPILLKLLVGSYVYVQFAGFESGTPAVKQMEADVQAVKPGTKNSLLLSSGYLSADMFIQAAKAALRQSKTLTSASLQKAASTMTYQIKGTVGPTEYPASYKYGVKACTTLLYDTDGTAFSIAEPYFCSTKTYPILPKFRA